MGYMNGAKPSKVVQSNGSGFIAKYSILEWLRQ